MNVSNLETDLLRAFVAVAQTGSFTSAADIVGRSQSAISQKVLRLEEILGRRVFARTSRALRLTSEGEQLLVVARRMLELNDGFIQSLRETPPVGVLRLGISENLVATQLPSMLSRFLRLYPRLQLELVTGMSAELHAAYDDDRLDVVIGRSKSAGLGRTIWSEPLLWMAATDYTPPPDGPARLVVLRAPCTYRETMTGALDAARIDWITACTASSLTGLQAAVVGGLGVTALGKSGLQSGMRILKTSDAWPALPTTEVVIVGEDSKAADIVRPLISFLRESLAGINNLTLAA